VNLLVVGSPAFERVRDAYKILPHSYALPASLLESLSISYIHSLWSDNPFESASNERPGSVPAVKLSAARKEAFLTYLRTALDSSDQHVIADAFATVSTVLRHLTPDHVTSAPAASEGDGPVLVAALLGLAQSGGLDLDGMDADDVRELRDALNQVLDGRTRQRLLS